LQRPAFERRVVVLRLLQGDEVPEGPGDLVALALEIAIGPRSGSEKGSEFAGNRRLFSEHDFHGCGFGFSRVLRQEGPASGSNDRRRAGRWLTGHCSRANAGAARQQSEFDLLYCTHYGVAEDVRAGRHETGMPACGRARRAEWRPPTITETPGLHFRNSTHA